MSELEDMMKKVLSSPEDMSRIMQLAQSLTGGGATDGSAPPSASPKAEEAAAPAMDPELTALMGRILRGVSSAEGNDKTALVAALKPYLKEERRAKIDRAMKIAKIAKIATGALSDMGGGGHGL